MLACLALLAGRADARDVEMRGQQGSGFYRIELRFDQPTKIRVRSANGVVVIAFVDPARIRTERLTAEFPTLVSAVRRDPDDTGLRIALTVPVRTSVLEAGERVFVDLLPPGWTGLPPGLPPEVVQELAERARVAEAKLREGAAIRETVRKPVALRVAQLPTLTRLVFEPPAGTAIRFKVAGDAVEATFDGLLTLGPADARPRTAAGVAAFSADAGERSLGVKVAAAQGYTAHAYAEEGTLVVDLAKPSPPAATPVAATPVAATPVAATPVAAMPVAAMPVAAAPGAAVPAAPALPSPAAPAMPPARTAEPARSAPPEPERPQPRAASAVPAGPAGPASGATRPGTVVPVATLGETGPSLLFPFPRPTAAAAFERGGRVTLVFETPDRLDMAGLPAAASDALGLEPVRRDGGFAVLRLRAAGERPARLFAEGDGWRLSLDARPGTPPGEARVTRGVGPDGQAQILATLPDAASVHWLSDDPTLALVTATGRPSGLSTERRFVEFALVPTLHGLAVETRADDVSVSLGRGGAIVSRRAGLTLSAVAPGGETGGAASALAIGRDDWVREGAGDRLERYRELMAAVADAPRQARGEARLKLARFLIANGMDLEATSLLALARQDDPAIARRRETLLLSGIAAVRANRPAEARLFLNGAAVTDDPEAVLWRSVLDARDRNWAGALAGFRRSVPILDRYAEEVAGGLWQTALAAALDGGDIPAAEAAMAGLDRLSTGSIPGEEHELARARLDEANGRAETALKAYDRLAEDASRPVSAEATLRGTALASRTGHLAAPEATTRLELLSLAWRGDEIELGTLVELARLYAEAGRWREMFATTRQADASFPRHDRTRALHDETARRFEDLFLGEGTAGQSPVDVLALYYDFRDFAPIGRRGDEIVRRLADGLVELDLLDQAAELLQHQVDKRLTGAGRAAVAARLAAIRLMAGKPVPALAALHATRLSDLPAGLRRFRLLLEAQAQAELGRIDLALEILEGEDGADFARMRAGILFRAARWREAGEAYEALPGRRWREPEPLSDGDRSDVIRAVLADIMAEETIALSRVRSKFAAKMADSPDAGSFDLLLRPGAVRTREFRALMREAGRTDTLRRLLRDGAGPEPTGAPERVAAAEPG